MAWGPGTISDWVPAGLPQAAANRVDYDLSLVGVARTAVLGYGPRRRGTARARSVGRGGPDGCRGAAVAAGW